ncbi:MAG: GAF domain-containing protein [Bacilli bacterium]|nr:GAF domain-containing protein [Bacilli bacterium]
MGIMIEEIKALVDKELPLVSNLSNVSAVINKMDNLNWCGFYLVKGETLYLGPFQGDVACTVIPFGKGVCGEAALKKDTIIVGNVLECKNHIACSSLSRSEIVVPIIKSDKVVAVIDLDSPIFNRFTENEKKELEEVAKILSDLF